MSQSLTVSYTGDCTNVTVTDGCSASATYDETANYFGSTDTKSITIVKADQTITFAALGGKTYGDADFAVSATASSGLAVSFASTTTSVCTVSGSTVHIVAAGDCTIRASQGGNSNYNAAPNVDRTFTVAKAATTTTVTFEAAPYPYRGSAYTATATVTGAGGLSQSLTVSYTGDCTNVTVTDGCSASATCDETANYFGSTDTKSITIVKADQTITFAALGGKTYGDADFAVSATASSGLAVSFASTTTSVCTVSGSTVHIVAAGDCTIRASQGGNSNYNAAPNVDRTFTVAKAATTTTVTFEAAPYPYRGSAYTATVTVTGAGGLSLTPTPSYTGDCTNVTSTNGCTASYTYAETGNYFGSTDTKSITISKADAVCTVTPYNVLYDGNPHTATGSCLGVLSEDLSSGLDLTHTTHTVPGIYSSDYWFFTSPNGNYNDIGNTTITDTITTGTLTGTVTNIIASQPVPDVTVTATGTPVRTGTTALNGTYSISGFGAGTYSFSAAKTKQLCSIADNGITADDAALISQYVVNLHSFTDDQKLAAHVSTVTSSISSLDAALIAQKVVDNCHPNNRSGQWVFNSGSLVPSVMNTDRVDNFSTYLMGDVDGDWLPGGANRSEKTGPASPNAVIGSLPTASVDPGTQVTIPFRIDNLAGKTIRSTQFSVEYDPAVVEAVAGAASVQGTNADTLGVVSNVPTPGVLKVAVYGAVPVGGDGTYVNVTFTVRGAGGTSTPLTINGFRFNANTDEVTAVNGRLTVRIAAAEATLQGRVLAMGGRGVTGARVTATSAAGVVKTGFTTRYGQFIISGLTIGETYTVAVQSRRFVFAPRSVPISDSVTNVDFVAEQ
ncbi:MAG: hypothetical protein IPI64_11155 [Chloracidobacterium sp.]|nr:hypothetical protein [Chloracidobacterium sp.]